MTFCKNRLFYCVIFLAIAMLACYALLLYKKRTIKENRAGNLMAINHLIMQYSDAHSAVPVNITELLELYNVTLPVLKGKTTNGYEDIEYRISLSDDNALSHRLVIVEFTTHPLIVKYGIDNLGNVVVVSDVDLYKKDASP